MGEVTGTRRGRPRKVVDVPNAVEEGADAVGSNDEGRADSGARLEPQPQPAPTREGWLGFVDRVKEKAANSGRSFNAVSHPAPVDPVIHADWPIKVNVGPESI